MTMIPRYIGLFLVTGAGGIVSGLFWLIPSGLMGAVLGMSLSAGVLWLGLKHAREGVRPSGPCVLATAWLDPAWSVRGRVK